MIFGKRPGNADRHRRSDLGQWCVATSDLDAYRPSSGFKDISALRTANYRLASSLNLTGLAGVSHLFESAGCRPARAFIARRMIMRTSCAIAIAALGLVATPSMAQSAPRMLVSGLEPAERAGSMLVEITVLNSGQEPEQSDLPDRIPAELAMGGEHIPVTLERAISSPGQTIQPGEFDQASYLLRLPAESPRHETLVLSLMTNGAPGYAFSPAGAGSPAVASAPEAGQQTAATSTLPLEAGQPPSAKPDGGNAFLGNLSSYAPIYAVYGPGTNSDGRLQISFKYQLFGDPGAVGGDNPLINGIHFAYTQRLFWNLGADSSPFRNIDYMPEVFYLLPASRVSDQIAVGGQAGFRHESNGRDGLASRSLNTAYIQPVVTMPVGQYTLSLGPRLSLYTGSLKDNPDIRRYRGNTSLFAEIGQDDGLRLTTNTRFNFSSGKGAIDAELSYPIDRIFDSSLNIYLFGQGFAGYGENLLDYDRKTTRLRIGIGIVR